MRTEASYTNNRVTLSPLLAEHVNEAYVSWLNDPEVTRFTEVSDTNTVASTRAYVETALASNSALVWRILSDDDHHIGNIRLSNISSLHQRAQVALMLGDRDYWGQGLATEAIGLVSRHGFESLGLRKLSAGVIEPNKGSCRAFEKVGYHLEATLVDHAMVADQVYDHLIFAKFNPVWPGQKQNN
jgi:[ribosomal protein S5]-alanine N-acetyltransferase